MDTAQWPQEIVVKPIEEIIPNTCTKQPAAGGGGGGERKATRPQKEQALNCPRCNSANTKFCYYNNYSLSQPRYFCKTCRRYWTEGGSLRNIPVGGGSRKNKRSSNNNSSSSSSTSSITTSSKKLLPDLVLPLQSSTHQNPNKIHHEGQDLNLAFPSTQDFRSSLSEFVQTPNIENSNKNHNIPSNSTSPSSHLSALELLTGITSSRGLNSFMPMPVPDPNSGYTSGFPLHEFKPTAFNFSVDGLGSGGYGGLHHGVQVSNSGRILFPFEDLKQVSSTSDHMEQNRGQGDSTGYWTGMLGGGSW